MRTDEELGEWLDASKIDLLHLCPRKFHWRHELGLVPKSFDPQAEYATPMQYGHALHKALESLYAGTGFDLVTCPCPTFDGCEFCQGSKDPQHRIPNLIAQFLINYPWDPTDEKDPRTRARGVDILVQYVSKWRIEAFDVVAVEVPFTIPFDEFNLIGRIDLVGRWRDNGKLFPNDHKSTTRFGELFDQQFKLSLQMGVYMIAIEQITKEPVDDAQVNAIRITTKIDEDSFKQIITSRSPEEKARVLLEIQSAWDHIKHYRSTGFWPMHAPFACSAYFRQCEYYRLCCAGAGTQKDLIQNDYEVKPWTPIAE